MSQKVTVFQFKNDRKCYHILQPVAAEITWESGCLLQLKGSEDSKKREATAFKSGMCVYVCTCTCICLKYCPVITYSYKNYEALSLEAAVGFPQIHPFLHFIIFFKNNSAMDMLCNFN